MLLKRIKCLLPVEMAGGGKSEHQRAGYFLTGSSGNGEIAPQKQTAPSLLGVRVEWWCKRPPDLGVNRDARKALSGAMPNRKAWVCPTRYAFG